MLHPHTVAAEEEYAVKAAFMLHFLNFVSWPKELLPAPDLPFRLCLVGGDPFGAAIEPITRKRAQGRPIEVVRIPEENGANGCQAVFIHAEQPKEVQERLSKWSAPGVLTIGDAKNFNDLGGIIGYVNVGNSVRFALNDKAAKQARLGVSVKLRKVAVAK